MSVDTSPAVHKDTDTTANAITPMKDHEQSEERSTSTSTSSPLASFWSPFNSLRLIPSSSPSLKTQTQNQDQGQNHENQPNSNQDHQLPSPSKEKEQPEPLYTPSDTPTFKRLQKTRLTGTRTKQLLRAASRAHDDPPPPPGLGVCCGSSCDPCVNDLWREERRVWRERWGVYAVEE